MEQITLLQKKIWVNMMINGERQKVSICESVVSLTNKKVNVKKHSIQVYEFSRR